MLPKHVLCILNIIAKFWDYSIKDVIQHPSLRTCVPPYSEIQVVSVQESELDCPVFDMPFSKFGQQGLVFGGRMPISGKYTSIYEQ